MAGQTLGQESQRLPPPTSGSSVASEASSSASVSTPFSALIGFVRGFLGPTCTGRLMNAIGVIRVMSSTFADDVLEGRRALVTGGGTGLGRAMTEAFLDHGAEVAIASRSEYEKAAEELGVHGYELDVRDEENCEAVIEQAVDDMGGLDLLVNNAAGNFLSPAENISANGWDAVTSIVMDGTFNVTRAASEALFEAGEDGQASVINIVATYAWTAAPFVSHSGAAKAGVLNLTRSLAMEWGDEAVRVNAIAPGPIVTEKASKNLGYADPEVQDEIARNIPLSRMGQPEEIGEAALFLASPAAKWVTGECLVVDGGQWLNGSLFNSMMQE